MMSESLDGWRVEVLPRHGRILLIVYKDGDVRGQIDVQEEGEKKLWMQVVASLNSKSESSS